MDVGIIKFSTPEAEAEFTRLLGKRITKEMGFLPPPGDGELVQMIQERGWESFCEAPGAVPMSIVREFYANARADQNGYSVVRGMTVDYTLEAICRIVGGTKMEPTQDDWVRKSKHLMDLDQIIHELCFPGTESKTNPSTNERLSFPASAMNRYARAWNIVKFLSTGTRGAIPHATIVTKLCTAVGVRWSAEEQLQFPSAPIDHALIKRLPEGTSGRPDPRRLGYFFGGPGGGRPQSPP